MRRRSHRIGHACQKMSVPSLWRVRPARKKVVDVALCSGLHRPLLLHAAIMGTGKKEANRKERQGKTGDGMGNVKVKGENFYR